ncbi:M28 family peptidase [Massilia suwonensis]|uniref:M28 family peptidase n=1 Tax=Massilia suwonensis TaxID=648895 RepID=A0ABW0MRP2_9BURK
MLSDSSPSAGIAAALLFAASLCWLALWPVQAPMPAVAPSTAPALQFSAARAVADLEALTRAPRPIASAANGQARAYLLARLRALGFEAQVQRALVQKNYVDYNANYEATMGVVHNVLVRVPGTAPDRLRRPSLLLAAHLDSEPASLGASGAAPMAALLETLRALRAGDPLENDVLVLFADGECVGSLGMQAFAEQHPWAREVGLALRFDGGGSGGPLRLYNTFKANRAAIDGWLRAAPGIAGSSLMQEVHQLAPRPLRIGALDRLGVPLLQFAHTGRPFGHDPALDTAQRFERATLQQMGDTMLRLTRAFGSVRIDPQPATGQVYFSLPFAGTVHYDGALVWPLARLACLLLAGAACVAMQRAQVRYPALLQALFVLPAIAVVLGMGAWQLWQRMPGLHRVWHPTAPDAALPYLAAVCALCTAFFVLALRQLGRRTGTAACMLAGLACLVVVLLLASWLAPGASHLFAWPLLAALAAFIALHVQPVAVRPAARLALMLAGVLPAFVLVLPALRDSFTVLSPQRMNVPIALLALLLGVSALLLMHARRYLARTLLLAGLGGLALAGSAGTVDEPVALRANGLVYYKDMPSWDAYWLHPAGALDPWERTLFAKLKEPYVFLNVFGWDSPPLWYAWAPRDGLQFPFVRILRNGQAPQRHADFTLVSQNRAPQVRLKVIGARVTHATVNGRVLLDSEAKTLAIVLYGMEDDLLHFRIDVVGDPIYAVRIEEVLPGLPERLLPARPQVALVPFSGQSIAADTLWFY